MKTPDTDLKAHEQALIDILPASRSLRQAGDSLGADILLAQAVRDNHALNDLTRIRDHGSNLSQNARESLLWKIRRDQIRTLKKRVRSDRRPFVFALFE